MQNQKSPQTIGSLVKAQNWRNITPQQSALRRHELVSYIAKYGNFQQFAHTFAAEKAVDFAERPEGCYLGDCPTLLDLREMYGKQQMRAWLAGQLNHVCLALGKVFVSEKLSKMAMTEWVTIMSQEYHYLKLTEWMLFFTRLQSGRYGTLYGALTPDYCRAAFKQFLTERNNEIDYYERQLKDASKPDRTGCVTREEYLRMKEAGELPDLV